MHDFFAKMQQEREHQKRMGWDDTHNTAGAWVCYIVNYASRFMMSKSFDTEKYTFGTCMVKTATLCAAAYAWWMTQKPGQTDAETVPPAVQGDSNA